MSARDISEAAESVKQHLENNDSQGALQSLRQEIDSIERSPASGQEKASEEARLFKQLKAQNKDLAEHGFPVLQISPEGKHFAVSKDGFEIQTMDFDWTSYSKHPLVRESAPGHAIPVKGFVNSHQSGYGDQRQFNINAYQGRLEINAKTGQPEFVGQLFDSTKLIRGPDGSQTNPYWNVRIPMGGKQEATSAKVMQYGGY